MYEKLKYIGTIQDLFNTIQTYTDDNIILEIAEIGITMTNEYMNILREEEVENVVQKNSIKR